MGTLGLWVLELFAMYATDGQTDGQKQRLLPPSLRSGHNNNISEWRVYKPSCNSNIKYLPFTIDAVREKWRCACLIGSEAARSEASKRSSDGRHHGEESLTSSSDVASSRSATTQRNKPTGTGTQEGLVYHLNISIYDICQPFIATLKPQSNGPLYSSTVIGTLAVDRWAVKFGTATRRLVGLGPHPVPSSL